MNKYLLHGKLTAKNENAEQLTSILLNASHLISTARGCILYVISRDNGDKNAVWITEIWESKEDHDNSLKLEKVRALFLRQFLSLMDDLKKDKHRKRSLINN